MTIQDRCNELLTKIESRTKLRLADKEAEALRRRAEELRLSRVEIANQLARLAVLRRRGVDMMKPPSPLAAVALLQVTRNALSGSPVEVSKVLGQLKRVIETFRKGVEAAAEKTIERVNRDLPSIDEGFLKQVEMIPEYVQQVANIRVKRDNLLKGLDVKMMTPSQLDEFLDSREALRSLTDQLLPAEFPNEVLDFFKAARHGGAPLDKFTNTVREWLSKRDQLKNVRVIVKS
jgi:hypothetical protein